MRIASLLLSNTSLNIKIKIFWQCFENNNESPQGDSISRIFFNIYLEDSLWRTCYEFNLKKLDIEHSYSKTEKSSLLEEVVYADDTDFIFKTKENSRPELFCKKNVEACNFIKKQTLAQVFFCEFCENFKNTFFYRTPPVAASGRKEQYDGNCEYCNSI